MNSKVRIIANGTSGETLGKISKAYEDAIGIKAKIKVKEVNGRARVILWKYLGKWGNHGIRARIEIGHWDDKYSLQCKIRERDENHAWVKDWAWVNFGTGNGVEWEVGDVIKVELRRNGENIVFKCEGYGKWRWTPPLSNGNH
jgi:hypothetical protein